MILQNESECDETKSHFVIKGPLFIKRHTFDFVLFKFIIGIAKIQYQHHLINDNQKMCYSILVFNHILNHFRQNYEKNIDGRNEFSYPNLRMSVPASIA